MGIDAYAKWDGQTAAERDAQITGYSIVSGHVGYLREAYHGEPYATKVLFPECWDDVLVEDQGVRGPLEEDDLEFFCQEQGISFEDVHKRSHEMLLKLRGYLGEHRHVEFDPPSNTFTQNTGAIPIPVAALRERLPQAINATAQRYADDPIVGEAVKSVVAFVELYERLEAEGKHPRVYVSY
jgi:hypothetical protein